LNKVPVKIYFVAILIIFSLSLIHTSVIAQNFKTPTKYSNFIVKKQHKVVKEFLRYNCAITTNARTKKIKRLYKKLLAEIQRSIISIDSMPAFKANKKSRDSLITKSSIIYRDSALAFMKFYNKILKEDSNQVKNIKKVNSQSYDKMKELLSTKELAYKKLEDANEQLDTLSLRFIPDKKNKKDELSGIMEEVKDATSYYNSFYLIFFKSYSAESSILDAVYKKNAKDVQANQNKLSKCAQEGLDQLDTLEPFKKDNSLIKNCKYILGKYLKEADKKIDNVTDYFSKADDFQKARAEFEKKPARPEEEVNSYGKEVKEFNRALKSFNKTMHSIFKTRKHLLNKWNCAADDFFDDHIPACIYTR
jgi:hypothetical protein